jgi:hypothetical protein
MVPRLPFQQGFPGKGLKERTSTVDLLELTSSDQLLFMLVHYFSYMQNNLFTNRPVEPVEARVFVHGKPFQSGVM